MKLGGSDVQKEESLLWTTMWLALADGINLKTDKVLMCDQPEDCGLMVDIFVFNS